MQDSATIKQTAMSTQTQNGKSLRPPVLTVHGGLNQRIVDAEYAVRGKIYVAAKAREAEGKRVIFTNTGNPQALGQKPISFPRQVLSLMSYPQLLDEPSVQKIFPSDVLERARKYLDNFPGGTGAYQDSRGNAYIREEVAQFLEERDGFEANPDHIFLTDGASPGIQLCLRLIIRDENDGIFLPIPQYPLYSASVQMLGGQIVGYTLDESTDWSVSVDNLREQVKAARSRGIVPRAFVLINPGNPTGQVMPRENLEELTRFCQEERLVILADEVYQENIYNDDDEFVSLRSIVHGMGDAGRDIELFSFHTVSKGVFGECGRRGGFFQAINVAEDVLEQVYKVLSTTLSSNVDGQIYVGLMCNPPKPGDPSYQLYSHEVEATLSSLKRRAIMVSEAFNALPGVSCRRVQGALYAFPQIDLPPAAIEAAHKDGLAPDLFYCLQLLEETGICAVPGSGFGQVEGTFHFRTTILPPEDQIKDVIDLFSTFHKRFLEKYGHEQSKAAPKL